MFADIGRRAEIVALIKERVETALNAGGTGSIQRAVLPGLTGVLSLVHPNLEGNMETPENKLRASVVELIGRLPMPEVPKPNLTDLLTACHNVLANDHEENGMVAQRVLFDIHKLYKNMLEEQSGPFFEWLKKV